jgi:hypothetical protein
MNQPSTAANQQRKNPHRQPDLSGPKSAMCGRLLVGKSLFHVFAALVGAAMCSAF